MQLSIQQLNQLSDLACEAVCQAGHYITQFDKSRVNATFKNSGSSLSSQVVTEVDLHSQAIIIEHLLPSCLQYDIALLSEENCADTPINEHQRFIKDYFWCIDPLDGTLPFIEGRNGYAVSVALVSQNGQAIISAIYLPASNTCYQSKLDIHGHSIAYKNSTLMTAITNASCTTLTLYCDQSFINSPQYKPLCKQLYTLLPCFNFSNLQVISGSGAVVNALSVLENSAAVYIKLPKKQQGGGALWDYSGTACFSQACNSWLSDMSGAPLNLNQMDEYYMHNKGVIFATNKALALAIIKLCKQE